MASAAPAADGGTARARRAEDDKAERALQDKLVEAVTRKDVSDAEATAAIDAAFGGGGETETGWGGELWLGRQALHAQRLTVTHPRTLEKLVFDAPMPEDMRRACEALGVDPRAAEA